MFCVEFVGVACVALLTFYVWINGQEGLSYATNNDWKVILNLKIPCEKLNYAEKCLWMSELIDSYHRIIHRSTHLPREMREKISYVVRKIYGANVFSIDNHINCFLCWCDTFVIATNTISFEFIYYLFVAEKWMNTANAYLFVVCNFGDKWRSRISRSLVWPHIEFDPIH